MVNSVRVFFESCGRESEKELEYDWTISHNWVEDEGHVSRSIPDMSEKKKQRLLTGSRTSHAADVWILCANPGMSGEGGNVRQKKRKRKKKPSDFGTGTSSMCGRESYDSCPMTCHESDACPTDKVKLVSSLL